MEKVWLASTYYMDPKLAGCSPAVEAMFTRLLAYAGNAETRGFLPENCHVLVAFPRKKCAVLELVSRQVLSVVEGGGYCFTAWADWQKNGDELLERREKDRERKRRKRAEEANLSADTSAEIRPQRREEKRREPTYVGSSPSVSDAHEPPKRSRGMRAVDAMNETARPLEVYRFMHEYEQASQTPIDQKTLSQIETAVTPLIAQGIPPEQVAAGIRAWEASDSFSATQIASFVHKAGAKASAQPAAGNAHDAKVVGYLDIGRSLTSQSTEARRELA
ncbi:hypothetical protein GS463_27465 [Rhodococcus hoagii]|nr:hypothetical protein [Prescottella equi]MBM4521294.1 hypothetical protein [Prescottella equi]MBM4538752.1 hypothetical protein [Prescottella equi]MBM4542718.1 hypothetical protein [Prescottella equi]